MPQRLKLAYFSPLNPVQSGISDYSEELLPALALYADLDLYLDNYTPANRELASQFNIYPAAKFARQAGRYDNYLFHMGNSAAHAYLYRTLLDTAGKGILVLHDFVMHHFMIGQYLNNGQAAEYIRQMGRRYGSEGESIAREVIKGKFAESLFKYPFNETAIEAAQAVLVHSRYAQNQIHEKYPQKPVGIARMGVPLPPQVSKETARARLGLPQDEFILVSLGHLNPYKRLDSALWAFRAFRREYPHSRFVLVGSPSPNYDVKSMISALGLTNSVYLTGYASMEQLQDYTAAADCCVNLRYPTAGETSASLLRIMGAGRPVIVSRTGAFEELPDDSVIKVDVDDAEEELLLEYLRWLAQNPARGVALGANARRYVEQAARLDDAAYDYYRFICQVLNRTPEIEPAPVVPEAREVIKTSQSGLPALVYQAHVTDPQDGLPPGWDELAQAAAEIGLDENDPVLEEVTRAARFAGL
jgi:glycosyltransferase involved in cell wall biosynthesis